MICDTRFSNEAVLETLGCMVIIIPPHHPSAGMAVVVKNPPASAADVGSVHGLGRSSGGGHGNPLQYSCLDTGTWWATDRSQRVGDD